MSFILSVKLLTSEIETVHVSAEITTPLVSFALKRIYPSNSEIYSYSDNISIVFFNVVALAIFSLSNILAPIFVVPEGTMFIFSPTEIFNGPHTTLYLLSLIPVPYSYTPL